MTWCKSILLDLRLIESEPEVGRLARLGPASSMIRKSGYRFSLGTKREAFARRSCSNKKIERDDDSKKSHPALANTRMSCLARKFVGPGQRRLAGERIEKNCRSRRVGGVVRQFQTSTPRRRHRLRRAEDLERRPPPPCRSRRSRVFGDRAPSGEFLHGAFKLHICGLMHRNPPDPPR